MSNLLTEARSRIARLVKLTRELQQRVETLERAARQRNHVDARAWASVGSRLAELERCVQALFGRESEHEDRLESLDRAMRAPLTFEGYPVKPLRAEPGDVLVLRVDRYTPDALAADLLRRFKAVLPAGVRAVILPESGPIEVVRPVADTGERCG